MFPGLTAVQRRILVSVPEEIFGAVRIARPLTLVLRDVGSSNRPVAGDPDTARCRAPTRLSRVRAE